MKACGFQQARIPLFQRRLWFDDLLREQLAYVVPLGIAHSTFLAWDEDDQDKALAYMREKAKVCVCGTRPEEWEENRLAYISHSSVCLGCRAIEEERHNVPSDERGWGAKVYLIKNIGTQSMQVLLIYPESGAQIQTLGANNPFSLAIQASNWFFSDGAGTWHTEV